MKISVIMPCHNGAAWVRNALQSIAAQTLPPHEIIVVNDASTDASIEAIESSGVPLTLLHTRHGNAAAARNEGARAVGGADWLAFLDADNHWFPNHLESLDNAIARNAAAVAGYAWPVSKPPAESVQLQETGRRGAGPELQRHDGLSHDDFLIMRGLRRYGFPTTGMVVLRERFEAIGGFDERQIRRHDFDMFMRATLGNCWFASAEATWWMRPPRPGDISSNKVECHRFALRAMKNHLRRYPTRLMQEVVEREARAAISTLLKNPVAMMDESFWQECLDHVPALRRTLYRLKYQYATATQGARA